MTLEIKDSAKSKQMWSTRASIVLAIFSLISGAAIFALAYFGMKQKSGLGSFNQPVLNWMVNHRQDQITEIMKIITKIGDPSVFIFIVIGFAILWAIIKKEIWRPLLLTAAIGSASIVSKVIKTITENARPPQSLMVKPIETDFSFPSGHTSAMMILCLMLGYLICSRSSNIKSFIFWIISTVLAVSAMTISRLYMAHHWLTDTVASVGLCLFIFAFFIIIDRIFIKITKR